MNTGSKGQQGGESSTPTRLLVVGAGVAGQSLVREIQRDKSAGRAGGLPGRRPRNSSAREVCGLPVLGRHRGPGGGGAEGRRPRKSCWPSPPRAEAPGQTAGDPVQAGRPALPHGARFAGHHPGRGQFRSDQRCPARAPARPRDRGLRFCDGPATGRRPERAGHRGGRRPSAASFAATSCPSSLPN